MKNSKFTKEQIAFALRQAEAGVRVASAEFPLGPLTTCNGRPTILSSEEGAMRLSEIGCHLFLCLWIALFAPSCGSLASPDPGLDIIASIVHQAPGSVTFRVGVENKGMKTESLHFTSGQFFDIVVMDPHLRSVWRWSFDLAFTLALWDLELAPGESRAEEIVWDLKGNDMEPLPPGSYRTSFHITSAPRNDRLSTVVRLTI